MVLSRPLAHTSLSEFTFDDLIMFSVGKLATVQVFNEGEMGNNSTNKGVFINCLHLKVMGNFNRD